MTVRVGINGFGRIGRNFLRAARESSADVEIVAVNDLLSPEINAHLLHYDSTYGRFPGTVEVRGSDLVVDGRLIKVFAERDPAALPWGEIGVEVVVESTGRFTKREAAATHLTGGAKRVVISAPSGDADATFVIGVNEGDFDPAKHLVISNASCTTNCFVPMMKVFDDAFGVDKGLMTTVHAYTNDQELLDFARDNLRRARAAAVNIVPTSTGAARATNLVMANMKGRLDGSALRVPIPVGIDHRLHGDPQRGDRRQGRQRGVRGRGSVGAAEPRSSSTPRTRSSRPTSSARPRRAPSTRRSPSPCRSTGTRPSSRCSAGTTTSGATRTGSWSSSRWSAS